MKDEVKEEPLVDDLSLLYIDYKGTEVVESMFIVQFFLQTSFTYVLTGIFSEGSKLNEQLIDN